MRILTSSALTSASAPQWGRGGYVFDSRIISGGSELDHGYPLRWDQPVDRMVTEEAWKELGHSIETERRGELKLSSWHLETVMRGCRNTETESACKTTECLLLLLCFLTGWQYLLLGLQGCRVYTPNSETWWKGWYFPDQLLIFLRRNVSQEYLVGAPCLFY